MAPQQIPALWVYVGRQARYAATVGLICAGLLSVDPADERADVALFGRAGEDGAAQQYEGVRRALRGIERANTTHRATHWTKGVQKWRKPAIYPPKPTVEKSVSACFAVRQNGAGEHNDPVIAVALSPER